MNIAELQNNIIQQILLIKDEKKLTKLKSFLKEIAPPLKAIVAEEEKDIMEFETFQEWNDYLQSIEYHDLDEFLPEYGMTNLEFRKFIWDSEHSGTMSYEEFVEDIKT